MLETNKIVIFIFSYSKVCVGGAGREEWGFEFEDSSSHGSAFFFFFPPSFVKAEDFNFIHHRLW